MSTADIAVVDDDRPFVAYISTFLTSRGCTVVVFSNRDELLQGVRDVALPDVILLAIRMLEFDGLEALRSVTRSHPAAQVVMLFHADDSATTLEAFCWRSRRSA